MQKALSINFDTPEIIANPFPVYEEIRAAGRVVRNELLGAWMVPGYADAVTAFTNPAVYSSSVWDGGMSDGLDVLQGSTIMISADPPEHTALRGVAGQAFRRSSVARLEKTITEVVDSLLDARELRDQLASGEPVEIVRAFTYHVPATVISLLLGVPAADIPTFTSWSDDLIAVMDSGKRSTPQWSQIAEQGMRSGAAMWAYLQQQVDQHRQLEQDDLINDLLVANENGVLDDNQILATLVLLLIAGNETTTKLIGTGLRLLAAHPDARRALAEDPTLMPGAVEEMLRFEGVTTFQPRRAKADDTVAGTEVKAGDVVLLLSGAANRDPAAFPEPGTFDIRRTPNRHLGFGHGIHHCLGNQLARLETRIALEGFVRRYPDYQVTGFEFSPVFLARGLEYLSVTAG